MMLQPRLKPIALHAVTADNPEDLAKAVTAALADGSKDLFGNPQKCDCGWVQFMTELVLVVPQPAGNQPGNIVPATIVPKVQ